MRAVRREPRAVVSGVRNAQRARGEVLRRVRERTRRRRRRSRRPGTSRARVGRRRAPARIRAVRRPRRVHRSLRRTRRRGHARAARPLLRRRSHGDRAVRRHGGEVHRRRRHGRLGRARRAGGRRRAGREGGHRPRDGDTRARPCAARACGRPHRRGRGDARRQGPGHGRGRPRQHGLAHPVGCQARHRPYGRDDEAGDRGHDRLRGRGLARDEGQDGADAALARAARRRGQGRLDALGGSRGAVRRPQPRIAARERPLPRLGGGTPSPARPRLGDRRHRQVAARMGVREVHRRPGFRLVLASRTLPLLRRRRRLLGAGGDGAHALWDRGRRRPCLAPARSSSEHSRNICPTPTSAAG